MSRMTPTPPEEWELDLLARYPRPLAIVLIMVIDARKRYALYLPEFAYWGAVFMLCAVGFLIGYQIPPVDTNPITGFTGNSGAGILGGFIGLAILPVVRGIWEWYRDFDIRLPNRKSKRDKE